MFIRHAPLILILALFGASPDATGRGPEPGDLYREFSTHNGGDRDWRVTDKEAVKKFDRAKDHLPNSRIEIHIDDLKLAVRAEALLDRWGGHRGTINKRIRFNDKPWIVVPEIKGVPDGIRPEQLFFQDNPVVPIPLDDLKEGINVFDADCDELGGFGWGQWGLYSMVVRVFYDNDRKGNTYQISGHIHSPASGESLNDNPLIEVKADAMMGVARIDVLASYDGYDEDGDGNHGGYHESHFQLVRGEPNEIRDHVGTVWRKPYRLKWNTHWVPDQPPGGVSLIARIQDSRGYWFVTDPVEQLSLARSDFSVKIYPAENVPEDFGVRTGETKTCTFEIPASDGIASASEAILHLRTWHGWDGHHEPIRINDHEMPVDGKNHFFDYDQLSLPPAALRQGTNTFQIHSETEHHMLEVLWPGPAIAVRIPKPKVSIREARYENRDHFVIDIPRATYWLDKSSGGLSRLVDQDGNDWIAFKMEPWDKYPASAASSFRGIPNLLFQGDEGGFGHPGWDRGTSKQINDRTILVTSDSGKWRLRWSFNEDAVHLDVETDDPDRNFWFLYEGPVLGRWNPGEQYFAADTITPDRKAHDYFAGDKIFEPFTWAYMGDRTTSRVLAIVHHPGGKRVSDKSIDTYSHLGNTDRGLASPDGMVVFGFGRGKNGIQPLLRGNQSFRIGLIESAGETMKQYRAIGKQLESW